MMKKIFIAFFICYGCLQLGYTLFDISTRSIDPVSNPDFQADKKIFSNGIYLISYADGHQVFFQNQNALSQSALNRGIDFIFNYRRSHIDEAFYKKNQSILGEKTGAGWWLWKPYFILKTMENTPEGCVIIYADSGAIFTSSPMPILKHLQENDGIFYRYSNDKEGTLKTTIDAQVASELGVSTYPNFDNTPQVWAGFMIFRNCQAARNFVKFWLDLCTNPSYLKGYGKSRHLHDQSLLNISLLKHSNRMIAVSEDDFLPMIKWQHRHPHESSFSLMPYQQSSMSYIEHKAWRFPPLKWLRYVLYTG
jgi:hypothetical protein